ncbi:DUF5719 family protein [Microbacterium deminutum]|uniref:Large extracellular alpha-helical protein n=1 Tax=Microbacterium deminutum TaxID=344164 RepID=A0ABN2QA15_9MICO
MSDRRIFRWATTSARILAATVASAVAVIAVVTAVSLPWPTLTREPVSVSATPAPAATVIVCDGGLLAVGRDPADAAQISSVAAQTITSGAADPAETPTETRLDAPALAGGEGPAVFTGLPHGRSRTDVAASGSATVAAPDISGFAASACRPPLLESWLVGGSGATGASDIVVLSNPGTVAATVQLTTYTSSGAQTPPGGELTLPAGTQEFVPLGGIALGEVAPVIRVSAVGAPVRASLQTSITRTLIPGGVDQVGAASAPEKAQTIAGVTVTSAPGAEGASNATTVLRMLSPAAPATATVTVTAVGATQPAVAPQKVPLAPGQPAEIELGGVPAGTYDVAVAADQPVVSAVWQTTGFDAGSDFAWYTASPFVSVPSLFATPAGPPPLLTLVNAAEDPAVVAVTSQDRSFRLEVTVPARASTTVRLAPGGVYELAPDAKGIRAGLSLTGDGALAGFPVWPADAAAPAIAVYP